MTGSERIHAERIRQMVDEGFTAEHDDKFTIGELLDAAEGYLTAAQLAEDGLLHTDGIPPYRWPWDESWWKPSENPIDNLVKAGALIAAEIDRLLRAAKQPALDTALTT